jgi:hypothetical protein
MYPIEFETIQYTISLLLASFMALAVLALGVMIAIFSKYYLFRRK